MCPDNPTTNSDTESRTALRKRLLAARDQMSAAERAAKNTALVGNLWNIDAFHKADCVLIYVSYRSEVETLDLIKKCLARRKIVAVPLTHPGQGLSAHQIIDPNQDLHPGYCGIPEPRVERTKLLNPEQIDTVLLPGSVFDLMGGRLGYGGGYYDRFLSNQAPKASRIGLCYELQVVEKVPVEDHDQEMHYLVTEKRTVTI